MADYSKLADLADKVLRAYPDFSVDHNASQIPNFIVIKIRRQRKAYGSFVDTDKVRQVQRDLLQTLRSYGYQVSIGRDSKDDFTLAVQSDEPSTPGSGPPPKKALADSSASWNFMDLREEKLKKKKPM